MHKSECIKRILLARIIIIPSIPILVCHLKYLKPVNFLHPASTVPKIPYLCVNPHFYSVTPRLKHTCGRDSCSQRSECFLDTNKLNVENNPFRRYKRTPPHGHWSRYHKWYPAPRPDLYGVISK